MYCFQKSAQSRLFLAERTWARSQNAFSPPPGRAKRISRLPLKGGAKAGRAKIFSGYLYAGGFSISLSDGISRLESGAFLHVLSVVDASTSGVRAGPTAPQLNPMLSHEHNMEAADKASIAKMAFFIVGVKRYRPPEVSQAIFPEAAPRHVPRACGRKLPAPPANLCPRNPARRKYFAAEFVNYPASFADISNARFAAALFCEFVFDTPEFVVQILVKRLRRRFPPSFSKVKPICIDAIS